MSTGTVTNTPLVFDARVFPMKTANEHQASTFVLAAKWLVER